MESVAPNSGPRWRRGARRALERLADERVLRRRRLPRIRTGPGGGEPTVYYLCPDYPTPSGGVRVIYRHVDILNRAGLRAAVLHHRDGYACEWFEHSTRCVGAPSTRLSAEDVLVVPEIYGPYLDRLPREPRLVAFNQNAYLTYDYVPPGRALSYDLFEAALTVSEDSAEYLRLAFPGLEVTVVGNAIDPRLFHPASGSLDARIVTMPRKRPREAEEILRLVGERLRRWDVVAIEGVPEREAAALLRSAPIFLALGRREGFGLPPAEAMASGCYVIGFPGFGGRELFDPECSSPVEDGDVLAAARALAAALERYEREPDALRAAGTRASERILASCSLERQEAELVAFYRGLGGRGGRTGRPRAISTARSPVET